MKFVSAYLEKKFVCQSEYLEYLKHSRISKISNKVKIIAKTDIVPKLSLKIIKNKIEFNSIKNNSD